MDEIIFYIVVGAIYLFYYVFKEKNKNESKTNEIPPISGNKKSSNSATTLIKELERMFNPEAPVIEKRVETVPNTPFLDVDLKRASKSHFSEEKLIENYKKAQLEGKQLSHHVHNYVDPEEFEESIVTGRKEKTHYNREIIELLKDKNHLQKAFVLKEILERPFS